MGYLLLKILVCTNCPKHSVRGAKMKKNKANPKDLIGVKKPNLSLFPGTAIIHGAKVMENGKIKYGLYNWREHKVQMMIYFDAALRHIYSAIDGEDLASDSNLDHIAHAMMCLAILLDAKEGGNLIDDRPNKGQSAQLIERLTK